VTVRAISHHSANECGTFPLIVICWWLTTLQTVARYTNCTTGKSNAAFSLCSFKGALHHPYCDLVPSYGA